MVSENTMTKIRNFTEITPDLPFSEFNFYDLYRETFEKTELGRTKFLDVEKANLTYSKQRRHSKSQTRKITRRLLDLLGKILKEMRNITTSGAAMPARASRTGL